ncbi:hypothetical protein K435DRAFT_158920 [Dendrothele bispora CBS 962.96]|uniref:Fungal-type protein kinase domain-containing protein n=1 Tax=Dendrothele bispora (strain CBS 962.96) TaxID=1314807 RepID=A0A4S8MQV0_DENBC|nr:hypothetical protein K435DRAFT_158920 [Dendrothele bispora CBS 962.96]
MLGVIMSPGGYMLSYANPCGYVVTEHFAFSNIAPLVSYVHSLHVPPAAIDLADPERTITLGIGPDDLDGAPRWRITDGAYGLKNHLFDLISIGPPFSRMTIVFADPEGDLVVKDSYSQDHRQREAVLFKKLREDPPGWVTVVETTDTAVKFKPLEKMNFGSEFAHRQRHRLVLRSTGLPFEKCETISEAVGAIYDLLESNRRAIVKRRFLHRDISPRNILIRPTPDSLPKPDDDVCFIRGLYDRNPLRPSLAIPFDLDNGVKLKEKHLTLKEIDNSLPNTTRDLKAPTGTPMFIARGPLLGVYDPPARPYMFEPLPQLQPPDAAERYEQAYPSDPFRKKQGKIGGYNEDLGNECFEEQPHTMRLIQRPWHDAESMILMFLIFLLRSKPKDSEPEGADKLKPMQEVYGAVRNTGIGTEVDNRDNMIRGRWRKLLHARLAHLAKSVTEMCQALNCDYEFLLPATGVNHEIVLHEILQRHLFQMYYKLNDPEEKEFQDVKLDTSSFRPYHKDPEPKNPVVGC